MAAYIYISYLIYFHDIVYYNHTNKIRSDSLSFCLFLDQYQHYLAKDQYLLEGLCLLEDLQLLAEQFPHHELEVYQLVVRH